MKKRNKKNYPPITWSESKKLFRATMPATELRKRQDVYGKTEDDVMDKIDLVEADEEHGISGSTTLTELAYRWFKLKAPTLSPKTREVYNNALTNHILPQLGSLPISEIKPLHVDELMATLDGKSASLRSKILSTLKQTMEMAIDNDLLTKNPCRNKKAGGEQPKEKEPLTKDQQDELIAAVKGSRAELFVLLCLYAGLRREEALGLLWSDVHFDDTPYIDIRHTVTFLSKGTSTFSDKLKSKSARRSIPIPPQLSEALRQAHQDAESIYVVYSETTHQHMTRSSYVKMWNRITGYTYRTKNDNGKKIEHVVPPLVSFDVHAHLLRHTYITELCLWYAD